MSLTYGFFDAVYDSDSGTYDRTYTAEQFSTYLKGIISDGVVANVGNQLAVTPHSGMGIQVGTGRMFINSRWMDSDTVIDLTVGAANGALPRKDIVIVRLDYSARTIGVMIKAGTAAAAPVAPTLQRDAAYYEMELAEIYVKAWATAITAADITDKRSNQTVCGYVVGLVDQIDTDGMWSQLEADFGEWFDEMKNQLSEDAAGNLQLEIDEMGGDIAQNAQDIAANATDIAALQAATTISAATTVFASYATAYISGYSLTAYKVGRMVFMQGMFRLGSTSAPAEVTIATLPAAFRPAHAWTIIGQITSGALANQARNMQLLTNGEIKTHNWDLPTNTWLVYSVAYVSAS